MEILIPFYRVKIHEIGFVGLEYGADYYIDIDVDTQMNLANLEDLFQLLLDTATPY